MTPTAGLSQGRLTFGMCVGVTAVAFESIAVTTAMPKAAGDLGHLAWYGWVFSTFQVGLLFASVVAGRMCDRLGPVRPLSLGMAIFAVGLIVAGSASDMVMLIVGRLIQGVGGGALNVALYVLIARVISEPDRPRVFSWVSTAWVLPSLAGPPVAAYLTDQLSWRWVFFSVLILVAVWVVLTVPNLVTVRRAGLDGGHPGSGAVPIWAAVLVAAAVPAIGVAGQRLDLWAPVIGVLVVILFVIALPRVLPAGFFGRGVDRPASAIRAVVATRGLFAGAFFSTEVFLPLSLVEGRDMRLLWAGTLLTVGSLGWTAGSWAQSRLGTRMRRDRIIVAGSCSITFGVAGAAITAYLPATWIGVVVAVWVVAGFGMGLATASTSVAIMRLSSDDAQGRNASSLSVAEALCNAILVAIAGSIFAALHTTADASITFGAVMTLAVVAAATGIAAATRIGPVYDTDSQDSLGR
ncbi:MFS family permease [Gordonia amarae]|uniref:Putative drug resistance transporter n=1 Tax=Gordonia amarae NBRC 15530 TaxID=1075090 RepID=G7GRD3_9ACTN|nr:MFS transporter [Gordonia amarae]MCS3878392.1 MFS family permease [Gordonia amarae]GAB06158.1 putative drug resistance transporter [Gordonia amarae NBRC 15530]